MVVIVSITMIMRFRMCLAMTALHLFSGLSSAATGGFRSTVSGRSCGSSILFSCFGSCGCSTIGIGAFSGTCSTCLTSAGSLGSGGLAGTASGFWSGISGCSCRSGAYRSFGLILLLFRLLIGRTILSGSCAHEGDHCKECEECAHVSVFVVSQKYGVRGW